ncbi:MAG: bifunctional oligoribonuclease/PAP phosphatase NrnA [Firmicutes bacterium HGW-Firmicutes-15]|nr:MAG: bifunctional oligoribonuclease/PAP phosphatase NrnA [Firmicutes bacterium HGW-Firmicutes-15]
MKSFDKIAREIKKRDDYLLVGHAIPDGDCIGSLMALYLGLLAMGKNVKILLQDAVPAIYRYLVGSDAVLRPEQLKETLRNVIFLDCSDEERTGEQVVNILEERVFTINIDHHQSNTLFGDLNYVDDKSSSTAELVLDLLKHLEIDITPDIANALYVGVVQDTGGFLHNSTSSATFRSAAELLDKGVNLDLVKLNLFESKSRTEIMLLSLALEHINFNASGKIAWMILNYEDVKAIGALDICPEGIINYTLMIKGVEVGLLFREISPGLIKIGFRSKGDVDVSALAAIFGGGGHQRAAGAKQEGSIDDAERQVILTVEGVVG